MIFADPPFEKIHGMAVPPAPSGFPGGFIYAEAGKPLQSPLIGVVAPGQGGAGAYHLFIAAPRRGRSTPPPDARSDAYRRLSGTFDPFTPRARGHGSPRGQVVRKVTSASQPSAGKLPFFTSEERVAMARNVLAAYPNVEVMPFSGSDGFFPRLRRTRDRRGLRAVSDSNTNSRWRE